MDVRSWHSVSKCRPEPLKMSEPNKPSSGPPEDSRARILFEEAPCAICLVDGENFEIIEINPLAAAYFSKSPLALVGSCFLSLFDPCDREVLSRKIQQAEVDGESVAGTARGLRADGSSFPFGYRTSGLEIGDRKMSLLIGRYLNELQGDSRYRQLFEASLEPIFLSEPPHGMILDCNPAFERLIGVSREELTGMTVLDLVPDDQRSAFVELLKGGLEAPEGYEQEFEATLGRRDGAAIHALIRTGIFNFDGRRTLMSFVRDLTAYKLAEARYKEMFLRSGDGIVLFDRSLGTIVEANPAFEKLTGLGEGSRWSVEDRKSVLQQLTEWTRKALDEFETTMTIRADGIDVQIPLGVRLAAMNLNDREVMTLTLTDRRAEVYAAGVEKSLSQAQKMESLGQMASGIAHDFNNTLMSALPWADLLRRKYPSDETIQKASDQVRRAVHRARDVTRQLLNFAQPKKPQMRRVRLSELVSDELRMIRPAIPPEITIELRARYEDDLVNVDFAQMSQGILNLALNAREAMPDGGILTIEVRKPSAEDSRRWNIDPDEYVLLAMCDTGTGIQPELLAKIFDPFFTTGKRTGLGLSVVHRIAEQHGGNVFVDSKPGKGSTFYFLLPRVTEKSRRSSPPAGTQPYAGITVLLIDDEKEISEGIKVLLESEGATVVAAGSGPEGLRAVEQGLRPDFVVLDLGMPVMAGEKVLEVLRKTLPGIPIIVISSGYGEQEKTGRLRADPNTRFKQKPFDIDELMRELAEMQLRQS